MSERNPEHKEVYGNIGGQDVVFNIGNVALAFFRNQPELDFMEYTLEQDEPLEDEVTWIYHNRDTQLWMHGQPVIEGDRQIIANFERENGAFTELSGGWRPNALITDDAPPEVLSKHEELIGRIMGDLNEAQGVPEEFTGDDASN